MFFRYREGEARKFASESDVPHGEGWQDTPVTPFGELVKGWDDDLQTHVWRKPGYVPEKQERLDPDLERAKALGIKVDGRWSHQRLLSEIAKVEGSDDDRS